MAATNPNSSLSSSPTSALTKLNGKGRESITGFVLKLNNMVNGAPDDIVSVSWWFVLWERVPRRTNYMCKVYLDVIELALRIKVVSSGLSSVNLSVTYWSQHVPFGGDRTYNMHQRHFCSTRGFLYSGTTLYLMHCSVWLGIDIFLWVSEWYPQLYLIFEQQEGLQCFLSPFSLT